MDGFCGRFRSEFLAGDGELLAIDAQFDLLRFFGAQPVFGDLALLPCEVEPEPEAIEVEVVEVVGESVANDKDSL